MLPLWTSRSVHPFYGLTKKVKLHISPETQKTAETIQGPLVALAHFADERSLSRDDGGE